ncbi:MAG: sigma-54-dependent Fis family transcriptional regulator [Bacteroidota bacterium]|nr:sigma-54-dependent Fis family transcriptional regulator [Bacteroidota bacterium]
MKQTNNKKDGQGMQYPIIGRSEAIEGLRKLIEKYSRSRNDVIIIGESGIGKGAVARNIHHFNAASGTEAPFMSINLSVVDDKEVEPMLFGFDRGAEKLPYTTKRGLFELANGGTVLIEELEEASYRNQMKVLNFMNSRTTRRMSSAKDIQVNVRLIVTMKENVRALQERRKLLPELAEKLAKVDTISISPLRTRPEDIPLLVKHFVGEISHELGLNDIVLDINAIDVLVRQPWRENIRELKAVVDKSVLFSQDGRFALPPELVDEKTEVVKMINNIMSGREFVLNNSLDKIEKGIIERALDRFGLNQSKAATFLGMTEQTLRYKLRRLGIASAREYNLADQQ